MKIRDEDGELIEARYVRHLRTLTGNPGDGSASIDVDLFRTDDGRLVVCRSPENNARVIPWIDPGSTPQDYGIQA